jgi:hypothetical protein
MRALFAAQALDEIVHGAIVKRLGDGAHRVSVGRKCSRAKLSLAQVQSDQQYALGMAERVL